MDYIAESIFFASRFPAEGGADAWRELFEGIESRAVKLKTNATGTLRGFRHALRTYPGNGRRVTELAAIAQDGIPTSLSVAANGAWRCIGGLESPAYASALIMAARVEFTRSEFSQLLWSCVFSRDDTCIASEDDPAKRALEARSENEWLDADSIARMPTAIGWCQQSAAFNFNEWLYHLARDTETEAYKKREPASSITPECQPDEMRAAIALAWLDEAAFDPSKALTLLSEAAEAMRDVGFLQGWGGHIEMLQEDRAVENKTFAQRGAYARHAQSRIARETVLQRYREGNYRSKDAAAEAIAPEVDFSFRTVRAWLNGLPPAGRP